MLIILIEVIYVLLVILIIKQAINVISISITFLKRTWRIYNKKRASQKSGLPGKGALQVMKDGSSQTKCNNLCYKTEKPEPHITKFPKLLFKDRCDDQCQKNTCSSLKKFVQISRSGPSGTLICDRSTQTEHQKARLCYLNAKNVKCSYRIKDHTTPIEEDSESTITSGKPYYLNPKTIKGSYTMRQHDTRIEEEDSSMIRNRKNVIKTKKYLNKTLPYMKNESSCRLKRYTSPHDEPMQHDSSSKVLKSIKYDPKNSIENFKCSSRKHVIVQSSQNITPPPCCYVEERNSNIHHNEPILHSTLDNMMQSSPTKYSKNSHERPENMKLLNRRNIIQPFEQNSYTEESESNKFHHIGPVQPSALDKIINMMESDPTKNIKSILERPENFVKIQSSQDVISPYQRNLYTDESESNKFHHIEPVQCSALHTIINMMESDPTKNIKNIFKRPELNFNLQRNVDMILPYKSENIDENKSHKQVKNDALSRIMYIVNSDSKRDIKKIFEHPENNENIPRTLNMICPSDTCEPIDENESRGIHHHESTPQDALTTVFSMLPGDSKMNNEDVLRRQSENYQNATSAMNMICPSDRCEQVDENESHGIHHQESTPQDALTTVLAMLQGDSKMNIEDVLRRPSENDQKTTSAMNMICTSDRSEQIDENESRGIHHHESTPQDALTTVLAMLQGDSKMNIEDVLRRPSENDQKTMSAMNMIFPSDRCEQIDENESRGIHHHDSTPQDALTTVLTMLPGDSKMNIEDVLRRPSENNQKTSSALNMILPVKKSQIMNIEDNRKFDHIWPVQNPSSGTDMVMLDTKEYNKNIIDRHMQELNAPHDRNVILQHEMHQVGDGFEDNARSNCNKNNFLPLDKKSHQKLSPNLSCVSLEPQEISLARKVSLTSIHEQVKPAEGNEKSCSSTEQPANTSNKKHSRRNIIYPLYIIDEHEENEEGFNCNYTNRLDKYLKVSPKGDNIECPVIMKERNIPVGSSIKVKRTEKSFIKSRSRIATNFTPQICNNNNPSETNTITRDYTVTIMENKEYCDRKLVNENLALQDQKAVKNDEQIHIKSTTCETGCKKYISSDDQSIVQGLETLYNEEYQLQELVFNKEFNDEESNDEEYNDEESNDEELESYCDRPPLNYILENKTKIETSEKDEQFQTESTNQTDNDQPQKEQPCDISNQNNTYEYTNVKYTVPGIVQSIVQNLKENQIVLDKETHPQQPYTIEEPSRKQRENDIALSDLQTVENRIKTVEHRIKSFEESCANKIDNSNSQTIKGIREIFNEVRASDKNEDTIFQSHTVKCLVNRIESQIKPSGNTTSKYGASTIGCKQPPHIKQNTDCCNSPHVMKTSVSQSNIKSNTKNTKVSKNDLSNSERNKDIQKPINEVIHSCTQKKQAKNEGGETINATQKEDISKSVEFTPDSGINSETILIDQPAVENRLSEVSDNRKSSEGNSDKIQMYGENSCMDFFTRFFKHASEYITPDEKRPSVESSNEINTLHSISSALLEEKKKTLEGFEVKNWIQFHRESKHTGCKDIHKRSIEHGSEEMSNTSVSSHCIEDIDGLDSITNTQAEEKWMQQDKTEKVIAGDLQIRNETDYVKRNEESTYTITGEILGKKHTQFHGLEGVKDLYLNLNRSWPDGTKSPLETESLKAEDPIKSQDEFVYVGCSKTSDKPTKQSSEEIYENKSLSLVSSRKIEGFHSVQNTLLDKEKEPCKETVAIRPLHSIEINDETGTIYCKNKKEESIRVSSGRITENNKVLMGEESPQKKEQPLKTEDHVQLVNKPNFVAQFEHSSGEITENSNLLLEDNRQEKAKSLKTESPPEEAKP